MPRFKTNGQQDKAAQIQTTEGPHYTQSVGQKSVNLKYSLILTEMFRFILASQFVDRYHSVVSCALNMEGLISNNFCKLSKY
jgi:hypothetical protein